MNTFITLYEFEKRNIGLSIRDQNDAEWEPPGNVYFYVVDSNDNIVINETSSTVVDNGIYAFIETDVTKNIGEYDIIWKIEGNDGDLFYHKTHLSIADL